MAELSGVVEGAVALGRSHGNRTALSRTFKYPAQPLLGGGEADCRTQPAPQTLFQHQIQNKRNHKYVFYESIAIYVFDSSLCFLANNLLAYKY